MPVSEGSRMVVGNLNPGSLGWMRQKSWGWGSQKARTASAKALRWKPDLVMEEW